MIQEHMKNIKLSRRLMMSAEMVTPGYVVADIGCDHAHTSIWLIKNGIAPRTVSMDVRTGPLEKALGNIRLYGLEDKIELRLSDGLEKLSEKEADSIIIAGMGGMLTVSILKAGLKTAAAAKEIILQPQSDIGLVRRFLREHGFFIVSENMCKEAGKFYNSIKAVFAEGRTDRISFENDNDLLQEVYDEFGEYLLISQNEILKELISVLKYKNERNIRQISLKKSELERSSEKKSFLEHEGRILDMALKFFTAGLNEL